MLLQACFGSRDTPRTSFARTLTAIVVGLVLGWATPVLATAPVVLIRDASLVSGSASARAGVDVLIESGVIREIGEDLSHPEARVIDASGKTLLPGLIDCHSHLQAVPGSLLRGDEREAVEAARKMQLRAYLAAGVTTVLDAAAPPVVLTAMRRYAEESNLGPRIEGLAPILTPEGGYGSDPLLSELVDWPAVGPDLGAVDELLRAAVPLEPVGVKVTVEDGFGPLAVWPLFDDDALAHIKARAAEHETPIFVHAIGADEYLHALKLEPHAFVHGGFVDSAPPVETLRAVKASGAAVITTVAIIDMSLLAFQPERLDDPWLRMLVPESQRTTAASPERSNEMLVGILEMNLPSWFPRFVIPWLAPLFSTSRMTEQLESSLSAIKAMHDAGIPLVMGSDMGNWPLFTSLFHAVGSIREMELLERAGIPREEVLAAATTRAAALLGKSREIGALEVGMKADLLIANRNPLDGGMSALRDLAYVMKNGEVRTPVEWMTAPEMGRPRD